MIAIIALLSITTLLILAVLNDINGTLLASGLTIIAGLGGYAIGKKSKPK